MRARALGQEATDDGSDSEEELAAFCPKVREPLGEGRVQLERTNHTVETYSVWLCVSTVELRGMEEQMRTLSFQIGLSYSVPLKNVQNCLCLLQ